MTGAATEVFFPLLIFFFAGFFLGWFVGLFANSGAPSIHELGIDYRRIDGWHILQASKFPGLYVANRNRALVCRSLLPSLAKLIELDTTAALHAKPLEAKPALDVAEAAGSDETPDRRVRASSAGGEEK